VFSWQSFPTYVDAESTATTEVRIMFAHADTIARRTSGTTLLRRALQLDGAVSGAMGLGLLAGGAALDSALGLPATFLWAVGAFLVPYAAALFFIASRPEVNRVAAWIIVAGNVLWSVDSVVLLAAGWYDVTLLGEVVVLGQAAAVLGFAAAQFLGLRRSA
jgi:hypothetical protein